jgi:hypothetical protein
MARSDLTSLGEQLTASGQLPPVLPLVLYNGVRRWQAPEEVAELVATVPGDLERYRPCLRYFLLDEGRFTEDDLAPLRDLAAALFRLENKPDTSGCTDCADRGQNKNCCRCWNPAISNAMLNILSARKFS